MRVACIALFLGACVALAGCASDPAPAGGDPLTAGKDKGDTTPSTAPIVQPPPPKPKSSNERWHFHDYWKGEPTITLLDTEVAFEPATGPDGVPTLSQIVTLTPGQIVPPETGFLLVNGTWPQGGAVNVTFRPADSQAYTPAGDLLSGAALMIPVTESMADVPHRAESFWRFNVTAMPSAQPPGPPPQAIRLVVTATIGRPLFIDPPHLDWWAGGDVLTLVEGAYGEIATARTPAANLSVPTPSPDVKPSGATRTWRVPVDIGRIVPEGAASVVVHLTWKSDLPDAKLAVAYREGNLPSEGAMPVVSEAQGSRVFAIEVRPPQTDTTYSNRTTWEFEVLPEGAPGAAFRGSFELYAWASKFAPDVAAQTAMSHGMRR